MCSPFLVGVQCTTPWIYSDPQYLHAGIALIVTHSVMGGACTIAAYFLERRKQKHWKRNVLIHSLFILGCFCRAFLWMLLLLVTSKSSSAMVFFVFLFDYLGANPTCATAYLLLLKIWWDSVSTALNFLVPFSIFLWDVSTIFLASFCARYESVAFYVNLLGNLCIAVINVAKQGLYFAIWYHLFSVSYKVRTAKESFSLLKIPLLISTSLLVLNILMLITLAVGFHQLSTQEGYFYLLLPGQIGPTVATLIYYLCRVHHEYKSHHYNNAIRSDGFE